MALTLYHNDMSSCSVKVRLVLAEKALKWESRHLDLRAGDALKPEYLLLNPAGVVPTLVDDGLPIFESTVICEYLDDRFPDVPLRPADPRDRARMRLWTKQLDEGVHLATGVVSTCIAFRHQFLRRTSEELETYLAAIPNSDRREIRRQTIKLGMEAPQFRPAVERVFKLIADMAASLESGPWLAGSKYSLADSGLTPYVERFSQLGFGDVLDRHPEVRTWADMVAARPNHGQGVDRWTNPKYVELFASVRDEAADWLRRHLIAGGKAP